MRKNHSAGVRLGILASGIAAAAMAGIITWTAQPPAATSGATNVVAGGHWSPDSLLAANFASPQGFIPGGR